jgi:hypothetical protein
MQDVRSISPPSLGLHSQRQEEEKPVKPVPSWLSEVSDVPSDVDVDDLDVIPTECSQARDPSMNFLPDSRPTEEKPPTVAMTLLKSATSAIPKLNLSSSADYPAGFNGPAQNIAPTFNIRKGGLTPRSIISTLPVKENLPPTLHRSQSCSILPSDGKISSVGHPSGNGQAKKREGMEKEKEKEKENILVSVPKKKIESSQPLPATNVVTTPAKMTIFLARTDAQLQARLQQQVSRKSLLYCGRIPQFACGGNDNDASDDNRFDDSVEGMDDVHSSEEDSEMEENIFAQTTLLCCDPQLVSSIPWSRFQNLKAVQSLSYWMDSYVYSDAAWMNAAAEKRQAMGSQQTEKALAAKERTLRAIICTQRELLESTKSELDEQCARSEWETAKNALLTGMPPSVRWTQFLSHADNVPALLHILEGICILTGLQSSDWNSMLRKLGNKEQVAEIWQGFEPESMVDKALDLQKVAAPTGNNNTPSEYHWEHINRQYLEACDSDTMQALRTSKGYGLLIFRYLSAYVSYSQKLFHAGALRNEVRSLDKVLFGLLGQLDEVQIKRRQLTKCSSESVKRPDMKFHMLSGTALHAFLWDWCIHHVWCLEQGYIVSKAHWRREPSKTRRDLKVLLICPSKEMAFNGEKYWKSQGFEQLTTWVRTLSQEAASDGGWKHLSEADIIVNALHPTSTHNATVHKSRLPTLQPQVLYMQLYPDVQDPLDPAALLHSQQEGILVLGSQGRSHLSPSSSETAMNLWQGSTHWSQQWSATQALCQSLREVATSYHCGPCK